MSILELIQANQSKNAIVLLWQTLYELNGP